MQTATARQVPLAAGMPLPLLLAKARRHGSAGLERRHLVVLGGLCDLLPHGSAAGKATAEQIAAVTLYSPKWVRHTLGELEEVGLVEWWRGGVEAGRPQPSVFRVAKSLLAEMVRGFVPDFRAALARRQASTRARIFGLTARSRHKRRSVHVEVAGSLSPSREVTGREAGPVTVEPRSEKVPEVARRGAGWCREALQQARRAQAAL